MSREIENWNRLKFDLGNNILKYLENDDVIEIMLNPDGSLWVEKHGMKMEYIEKINSEKAMMIINSVAFSANAIVDKNNPDISTEFPIDGSRFQGSIPPISEAPAFTIRKKAIKVYSLNDYMDKNVINFNQYKFIQEAIINRSNILVVGAAGSGKTTFCNAIINEISLLDTNCRVGIIEDTKELQCTIKNKICLKTSSNRTMQDLLKNMMRLRPDRICVGEIRGVEAYTLLMAWNTGHNGGVATIHANSAISGIKRIEQILNSHNLVAIPDVIAEAVNIIISIQKTDVGRVVKDIIKLESFNNQYKYNSVV
jgi:type IV secretion system protein VirB11